MDGEWGWEEEEESPVCGLDGKGCLA
jgi:hypothetical protein